MIAELDNRVTDKILEPTNAELLKKLITNASDDNEAMMIAALGTSYKKTGLYFDKRIEKMSHDIHYFKKNQTLSFHTDDSKPTHKLIIGDNYEALQNLLIEYENRIDVIYIDPPYGKDSMGEFAKTNYQNAISRDNLLSMLYPRLKLAKWLLSDNGVIFCSIDDKNQAYVKCLFDEIFEERNYAGTVIWQSATDNNPSQISTEHEYIICFCRNLKSQGKWFAESKKALLIQETYLELKKKYSDEAQIERELRKWIKSNKKDLKGVEHYNNVDKKGVYSNSTNSSNTKPGGYTFDIIHPKTKKPCVKPAFGWRWKKETFLEYDKNGDIEWGKDEKTQPHVKKRIETVVEQFKSVYYEDGRGATKILDSIFGNKKIFDNPKPIKLINKLLSYTTNADSIILDFFAGSGSTGHAVLDLNETNGFNHQFILCQLNEDLNKALKSDTNNAVIKNQIALCKKYKRPCELSEITVERLRRVMTGKCFDGSKDFPWLKENKPYGGNLDVYELSTVFNGENTKNKSPFDVIDETLYGEKKFKTIKEKIKWVCENFQNTQMILKNK